MLTRKGWGDYREGFFGIRTFKLEGEARYAMLSGDLSTGCDVGFGLFGFEEKKDADLRLRFSLTSAGLKDIPATTRQSPGEEQYYKAPHPRYRQSKIFESARITRTRHFGADNDLAFLPP